MDAGRAGVGILHVAWCRNSSDPALYVLIWERHLLGDLVRYPPTFPHTDCTMASVMQNLTDLHLDVVFVKYFGKRCSVH